MTLLNPKIMKKDTRKLIRMAMVTSPLLAIYNVTPISLMLNSGMIKGELPLLPNPDSSYRFVFPVVFITINALLVWLFNIWIVIKARERNIGVGVRYMLSFLFTFFLVVTFSTIGSHLRPFPDEISIFRLYPLVGMAANNIIILIIIDLILNRERKAALEIEKANLQALNLKSRHDQLKQQIQPHFLFNALNTLKILISKDQSGAESYTVRLSNFLRSSIAEGFEEKVTVKKDLEIFEDFMELQKVRFPDAIKYGYFISKALLHQAFLPAFTMQTLAENAIKHNEFSAAKPLIIEVYEQDGVMLFSNNYAPLKQQTNSVGIGLKNLSERFKILSGEGIEIEQDQNCFNVKYKVIDK